MPQMAVIEVSDPRLRGCLVALNAVDQEMYEMYNADMNIWLQRWYNYSFCLYTSNLWANAVWLGCDTMNGFLNSWVSHLQQQPHYSFLQYSAEGLFAPLLGLFSGALLLCWPLSGGYTFV
jgi:hypothetical protein